MDTFINILYTFDFQSIFKLILGFILTGIIGSERDSWNKPAGFRTHSLVGISAVLLVSYSYLLTNKLDHFNSSELIISIDKDFSNSISAIEQILDENKIEVKKIDKNNKKDNDEKVVKIHIKYKNDTKITKIITAISSLENISEVEES